MPAKQLNFLIASILLLSVRTFVRAINLLVLLGHHFTIVLIIYSISEKLFRSNQKYKLYNYEIQNNPEVCLNTIRAGH